MSKQNESAGEWNNLPATKRSRAVPAKKVFERGSAQSSVQSSTGPSVQPSIGPSVHSLDTSIPSLVQPSVHLLDPSVPSTGSSGRSEKGVRTISGQSIKIISVETTTGPGS